MSVTWSIRSASVIAACCWLVLLGTWFIDDAGIVFAYARNLSFGLGAVPHPHSAPVEGFSDPLWMVALAVARSLGLSITGSAKLLGLTGTVLSCWLIDGALTKRGASTPERVATSAVLALCAPLWLWSASGLETGWVTLALTAVVVTRHPMLAAVAAAALMSLRPEAPVLLAGALAGRRAMGLGIWSPVVGGLIGMGAVYGVRVAAFDTWWPQTASAKLGASLFTRLQRGAVYALVSAVWLGLPLLVLGTRRQDGDARLHALSVASGCVAFAMAAATLYMGGDWMRYGRFWVPVMPIVIAGSVPALVGPRHPRWLAALALWQGLVCLDVARRPPLPMPLVTEAAQLMADVAQESCATQAVHLAMPDVGGALWSLPRAQVTDLAALTTVLTKSSWSEQLRANPPDVVLLHGPWSRRTGLEATALDALNYDVLCERPAADGPEEAGSPTTLWRRRGCSHGLGETTRGSLDAWCARPR